MTDEEIKAYALEIEKTLVSELYDVLPCMLIFMCMQSVDENNIHGKQV